MLIHRADWRSRLAKSTTDYFDTGIRPGDTNHIERCSLKKLMILTCLLVAASSSALADNFIYGNNASNGSPYVFQINKLTGAVTNTYTGLSGDNGRGVVVVGNTMYYTSATTNSVYSYNLTTHTDNGALFTVAGSTALSTIAYDGTNFWIGDYSGTNHAYLYSPTGTLLKTVSLSACTAYCDGLEYFVKNGTGYLLSNEADGSVDNYDLYDTNGNLIQADYLDASAHSSGTTGIAFDGTDFYTSNIFAGTLNEWSESGAFIQTITLTGAAAGTPFLIEDLSADYAQVLGPPPSVPEPSTFVLVGSSMLGLAGAVRRRFARRQK
jgi:PEP-CTERM motif